jgi:hypothetical protein
MMISKLHPILTICILSLAILLTQGCATSSPQVDLPPTVEQQRITDLSLAIRSLNADIDAAEAQRAARIAIEYSRQLAQQYEITDSPVMHNFLVNIGVKPRGLCVDWTSDLLVRLQQERFYSLKLHWGIANYETAFRLEHSTVIVSARGDSLKRGLVLDPWRYSGHLFWAPTLEDPAYNWHPQAEIHALKRQHETASASRQYFR